MEEFGAHAAREPAAATAAESLGQPMTRPGASRAARAPDSSTRGGAGRVRAPPPRNRSELEEFGTPTAAPVPATPVTPGLPTARRGRAVSAPAASLTE